MELFGLNKAELSDYCKDLGHPAFRGKQIAEWLYKRNVKDISQMTNLPAVLLEQLSKTATITRSEILKESKSPDATAKYLLKLSDGETIECVLLPYSERTSVCVSSQVGCPVGCAFCATADCGFVRNLTAAEILDQVLTLQEIGNRRITHVVFMGMGEPLLNLDQTLKAVSLLNEEVGIGMRHITISTVGIIPAIECLKDMDLQLTLAISLHAPNDGLRRKLIPISSKYPLDELMNACRGYADFTKRRITFEYLLIAGVNDSIQHAEELTNLLKHTLCNVNLIPYNKVIEKHYERPTNEAIKAFRSVLENAGIEVTQRMERGHSVSAACGQLKAQSKD